MLPLWVLSAEQAAEARRIPKPTHAVIRAIAEAEIVKLMGDKR